MPEQDGGRAPAPRKPLGWLVGLGVLLITLGVVFGLVGISIVAKRRQMQRINEAGADEIAPRPAGTNIP
jgi:hypothetical protein